MKRTPDVTDCSRMRVHYQELTPRVFRHLETLYGTESAAAVAGRLCALLHQWQPRRPPASEQRESLGLTQRDALLITYADQLTEAGEPPLRTLAGFSRSNLKGTVSGVHLLPFYPWSSDDGFSVKDFGAVEPSYGTWEHIADLGSTFDLMFDGVFNHVSAQGEWFQRFLAEDPRYRDFFISVDGNPDLSQVVRPRALPLLTEFRTPTGVKRVWTTFSADQVDLNFRNPDVLLAVVEALLVYVSKGARFIRLDAIAFLWKKIGTSCLHRPQTHAFIRLLRSVLDDVAPRVLLVTETNVPHDDNLSYFGDGTNEAQLVYNFALPPLVLHTLATGSAETLTAWAHSLRLPSDRVTFLNFLASHDGIGLNPVRGILTNAEIDALVNRALEHGGFITYKDMPDGSRQPYEMNLNYLDALSNPAANEPAEEAARKFLTAHAILLSLQGVPALYFHSLVGSRGDRAGAEASGVPRRINREKLPRRRLEAELNARHSLRAPIWCGLKELIRIRRAESAFHPQADQRVVAIDRRVFAVWRIPPETNDRVLCLHNCSAQTVPVTGPLADEIPAARWTDLLSGERYGLDAPSRSRMALAGFQTRWLRAEDNGPNR